MERIQRRVMRWRVQQDVKVHSPGSDALLAATVHDVSLKGMHISLEEPLPTRMGFLLTLLMADHERLSFDAWVCWRREEAGRRHYGLCFTRIQDRDKEKICHLIRGEHPQCFDAAPEGASPAQGEIPDRRLFQRFHLRCPVSLAAPSGGTVRQGETSDFSSKGLGLRLDGGVVPGASVTVRVSLPGQGEPFSSRGTAVWSSLREGVSCAGINLDTADFMGLPRNLRLC